MAGGTKFVNCYNLKIQYNDVHNNNGPGLWTDIINDCVLMEHNETSHNIVAGIFMEIRYHETIRYNYITYDGSDPRGSSLWWGAGILIGSSPDVDVYDNIVKYCMNGIGGIQSSAGTGTCGPHRLENLSVHNNAVYPVYGTAEGIVKSSVYGGSVYTRWNNHFQNNTYYLSYPTTRNYFYWLDAYHTLAWWEEYSSLHWAKTFASSAQTSPSRRARNHSSCRKGGKRTCLHAQRHQAAPSPAWKTAEGKTFSSRRRLPGVVLAVFAAACQFIGGQMARSAGNRVKLLYGGARVRTVKRYGRNLPV